MGIEQNELADNLAKQATNEPLFDDFLCSKFDLKNKTNQLVRNVWDDEWKRTATSNKLKCVKENVLPWKSIDFLSRRESIILTRLRIGHTSITHSYLLKRSTRPMCSCGQTLTVNHVFSECIANLNFRNKYGINLDTIGSDNLNNIKNIFLFLKDTNLFDKI
jgi:hypothetical protein